MKREKKKPEIVVLILRGILCIPCVLLTVMALGVFVLGSGETGKSGQNFGASYPVMDRYNTYATNVISDALDGVLSIQKVYWLSDSDLVAPEPDQNCYGEATDPAGLSWLLEDAAALLDGQDTLFNPDVQILPGSKVSYYLDETILAVTWKQVMDNSVYTISEIKIAHPSQFRRFLAGGEYSSGAQYMVSEMAASVNAVVAANGDFYGFRNQGIVVYDSQLMRMEGEKLDVCLLDRNGDLRFLYAGQMTEQAEVEAYLEENGVRFSLAFGPILIDNGVIQNVERPYPIGSGFKKNARAALCQLDSLHYLLVAVSAEPPYAEGHELSVFSENLLEMGCTMAYNLDGGQSATIVMNDEVKNYVYERRISDIIYFATALPEGE